MQGSRAVNTSVCIERVTTDYAHVGLFDVSSRKIWIARKRRIGTPPIRMSHARLLNGGSNDTSTADKDRFLCFWFHTPNTGQGYVQGYPIEWHEAHLLVRLDPNWSYLSQEFIPNTDTARIEANLEQQYDWGEKIFKTYVTCSPDFPLSWHMIGPRPSDSMFYIQRVEAQRA